MLEVEDKSNVLGGSVKDSSLLVCHLEEAVQECLLHGFIQDIQVQDLN